MRPGYIADRAAAGYDPAKWFEGDLVTGVLGGIEKPRSKPVLVRTYRCVQCGYLESYADKLAENGLKRRAEADTPIIPRRLWLKFFAGLAYAAFVANVLSISTHCTLPFAFAAVLGSLAIYACLGIWWLTLWARQRDARLGQFGIGSLLLLMVFVAIFLGMVRWIAVQVLEQSPQADSVGVFCMVALACLFLACFSIPFVLCMSEAVLRAAVWFINRPQVRRWLRERRRNDRSSIDPEMPHK